MREQTAEKRAWAPGSASSVSSPVAPQLRLVDRRIESSVPALPPGQLTIVQSAAKRALDLFVSGVLLVLLTPVLMLTGIAIRLDSAGPALFRQWRTGLNGQPFRIVKFRTLNVTEDGDEVVQVKKHDRRVTRLGQFLRRYSIDELPQLINVLRGEMSLVGPRPHAIAHDRDYSRQIRNYYQRLHVKPGLTGWAQIHGLRGETTLSEMRERVSFDVWYVDHAGFLLDLRILLATPRVVLGRRNAW